MSVIWDPNQSCTDSSPFHFYIWLVSNLGETFQKQFSIFLCPFFSSTLLILHPHSWPRCLPSLLLLSYFAEIFQSKPHKYQLYQFTFLFMNSQWFPIGHRLEALNSEVEDFYNRILYITRQVAASGFFFFFFPLALFVPIYQKINSYLAYWFFGPWLLDLTA